MKLLNFSIAPRENSQRKILDTVTLFLKNQGEHSAVRKFVDHFLKIINGGK